MDNFEILEPILYVAGGIVSFFMVVITGLISWIAIMFRAEKNASKENSIAIINRADKQESWIMEQQKELNELGRRTDTSIELIKLEQKQAQERLKIFQDNFFKFKRGK